MMYQEGASASGYDDYASQSSAPSKSLLITKLHLLTRFWNYPDYSYQKLVLEFVLECALWEYVTGILLESCSMHTLTVSYYLD